MNEQTELTGIDIMNEVLRRHEELVDTLVKQNATIAERNVTIADLHTQLAEIRAILASCSNRNFQPQCGELDSNWSKLEDAANILARLRRVMEG
jgi:hypothetical protein